MIVIAAVAGALVGLVILMLVVGRRPSRLAGRSGELGTVSRQWLEVHRLEDR